MSAALAAVFGVSEIVAQLGITAVKLAAGARRIDDDAANRMVERMRADAPELSGRLRAGITAELSGEVWTVKASAVDPGGRKGGSREGADYASFVESGTDPRQPARAAADDSFFAGASRKGHPGTDPQPFFWDNARAVLGERFDEARALAGQVESDF